MARTAARFTAPKTATALARRTAAGVGVAVVALLLTQALVDAAGVELGAAGPMTPFAAGPLVATTVVAGVGAAVAYAALSRFTDNPGGNFVAVAGVVFAVMLVPVFLATPGMGVTPAGQALLIVYHLLVALSLVGFIVGVVDV